MSPLSRDFACTAGLPALRKAHGDRQPLGCGGRLPQVVASRRPSPHIGEAVKGKSHGAGRSEPHGGALAGSRSVATQAKRTAGRCTTAHVSHRQLRSRVGLSGTSRSVVPHGPIRPSRRNRRASVDHSGTSSVGSLDVGGADTATFTAPAPSAADSSKPPGHVVVHRTSRLRVACRSASPP